jgi:serine/threonine-protein kinase HipA
MNKCFGCYAPTAGSRPRFCAKCQLRLFDGRKVSPILPFALNDIPSQPNELIVDTIKRTSISGVQFKAAMRLTEDAQLQLTTEHGQLEYILKPPPRSLDIGEPQGVPANEHLTMQLARQVFKLRVAENALLQFADGTPAYLTRRFDVHPNHRLHQEDFAQIADRSQATHGLNFKYEFSYEEIARLIQQHIALAPVALDELFRQILVSYLVSNGDAHLKNFSVHHLPSGEYALTPAYDILSTVLHVNDGNNLALELFAGAYTTPSFDANGFLAYDDFLEFGRRIGLPLARVRKLLNDIVEHEDQITALVQRSFLSPELQQRYLANVASRRTRLRYSMTGLV